MSTPILRLADDDGTTLLDMEGGDFYTDAPYEDRGALPGEQTVPVSIPLVRITDRDGIRRDVNHLQQVLTNARLYHSDPLQSGWTWLEWITPGEDDKRALVYGGSIALPGESRIGGAMLRTPRSNPVVAVDRHRYWETPTPEFVLATNVSLLGGTVALSGEGTADSRIGTLTISLLTERPYSIPAGPHNVWAGIRPTYAGTGSFEPTWDLLSGTLGSNTTSQSDGEAVGGTAARVAFSALNTDANRVYVKVGDILGSNEDHMIGRYRVLLRYKLNGTTSQAAIRLRSGVGNISDPADGIANPRVFVTPYALSSTAFDLVDLGVINIPWLGNKLGWGADQVAECALAIDAELLAGTPASDYLWLDTITLIPADRFLYAEGVRYDDVFYTAVHTLPNDDTHAVVRYVPAFGDTPLSMADLSMQNFTVPREGGVLVIATTTLGIGQDKDRDIDIDLDLYRRWTMYRRQVAPNV